MKIYNNGEFKIENVGEEVELYGWVQRKRNLGGLIFIDLRDKSGIIQIVIRPEQDFYELASSFKNSLSFICCCIKCFALILSCFFLFL